MDEETNDQGWLTLTIRDAAGEGVEASRLSRLLDELSGAFLAIAREQTGTGGSRRGRRTAEEDAIAGVRVVRVRPGSMAIELAPPASANQIPLDLSSVVTPDDVALELYEEVRRIQDGDSVPADRRVAHRRVRNLLRAANDIGGRTEIVYRPHLRRSTYPPESVLRAEVSTQALPDAVEALAARRRRTLSGHAYMVDVEPGRERMRVKLPDNRDLTLDVDEALLEEMHRALDQVVSVEVEEEVEGETVTRRLVQRLSVLPRSRDLASGMPPKTIEELAREQRIADEPVDYVALASEVWSSEDDLRKFEEYLREIRSAST